MMFLWDYVCLLLWGGARTCVEVCNAVKYACVDFVETDLDRGLASTIFPLVHKILGEMAGGFVYVYVVCACVCVRERESFVGNYIFNANQFNFAQEIVGDGYVARGARWRVLYVCGDTGRPDVSLL